MALRDEQLFNDLSNIKNQNSTRSLKVDTLHFFEEKDKVSKAIVKFATS